MPDCCAEYGKGPNQSPCNLSQHRGSNPTVSNKDKNRGYDNDNREIHQDGCRSVRAGKFGTGLLGTPGMVLLHGLCWPEPVPISFHRLLSAGINPAALRGAFRGGDLRLRRQMTERASSAYMADQFQGFILAYSPAIRLDTHRKGKRKRMRIRGPTT